VAAAAERPIATDATITRDILALKFTKVDESESILRYIRAQATALRSHVLAQQSAAAAVAAAPPPQKKSTCRVGSAGPEVGECTSSGPDAWRLAPCQTDMHACLASAHHALHSMGKGAHLAFNQAGPAEQMAAAASPRCTNPLAGCDHPPPAARHCVTSKVSGSAAGSAEAQADGHLDQPADANCLRTLEEQQGAQQHVECLCAEQPGHGMPPSNALSSGKLCLGSADTHLRRVSTTASRAAEASTTELNVLKTENKTGTGIAQASNSSRMHAHPAACNVLNRSKSRLRIRREQRTAYGKETGVAESLSPWQSQAGHAPRYSVLATATFSNAVTGSGDGSSAGPKQVAARCAFPTIANTLPGMASGLEAVWEEDGQTGDAPASKGHFGLRQPIRATESFIHRCDQVCGCYLDRALGGANLLHTRSHVLQCPSRGSRERMNRRPHDGLSVPICRRR
jgi:hypothetical protein